MNKNIEIAIIGGGIGGLTTALCLEHFGFKNFTIYERASEFKEVGAAISLWPNALKVYEEIGIISHLKLLWGEMKAAYIKTDKGEELAVTKPQYSQPLVCIHRADLHNTLLHQISPDKLKANAELVALNMKEGKIQLVFKNGATLMPEVIIGADGIKSKVREEIIGDGNPIFRGYNIWRGVATLKDTPQGYSSETWGVGSRVGIVPIKDGKFGWWATINELEEQDDQPSGTLNKLKKHFGDWHHPIPHLFENSPEIIKNKIGDRIPHKGWSLDNMILMGDAAHATTPNLGQGACMAIEGAYLLAKALATFNELQGAFQAYETAHFKRTSDVVKQSLQNGKMGQIENKLGIKARNTLIKATPPKLVMKMLDKYFSYDVTKVNWK